MDALRSNNGWLTKLRPGRNMDARDNKVKKCHEHIVKAIEKSSSAIVPPNMKACVVAHLLKPSCKEVQESNLGDNQVE